MLLKDLNRLQPNDPRENLARRLLLFRLHYQPQIEALLTANGEEPERAEQPLSDSEHMWHVVLYRDSIPAAKGKAVKEISTPRIERSDDAYWYVTHDDQREPVRWYQFDNAA